MGDIHAWCVEILNIAAIGILVALMVSLNVYLTMQCLRDMSRNILKPRTTRGPRSKNTASQHVMF